MKRILEDLSSHITAAAVCPQWSAGRVWTAPLWPVMTRRSTANRAMGKNTVLKAMAMDREQEHSTWIGENGWESSLKSKLDFNECFIHTEKKPTIT